ncbi:FAD-binding protein [Streptomyces sp. NPDC048290]|uniref:FAD-binding protein n=1 Tax=Streptomyces sp. NPDC048290 TaxID=3155811 RepID=UPI0034271539
MLELLCDHPSVARTGGPIPRRVLVSSTAQARRAVATAVAGGHRIAATAAEGSAGADGSRRPPCAVVDVSAMTGVYFDPERGAFAVEAGARPADVQRILYQRWGVTVPSAPGPRPCGLGCHRALAPHGLCDAYQCAVEVVLVDSYGQTRAVVATNAPGDPHRDLWLAHMTVGAEQIGLVTRYWFRTPGADGDDPATLLPRAPSALLSSVVVMPSGELGHRQLPALLNNYRRWRQQRPHTNARAAYRSVLGGIALSGPRRDIGVGAVLALHVDSAVPEAEQALCADRAALTAGLTLSERCRVLPPRRLPWLAQWHTLPPAPADPDGLLPVEADCDCELCSVTASALCTPGGTCADTLIALDAFSYGPGGATAATPTPPHRTHARDCRTALQTRTAKAAWDPRGVFL